MSTKVELEYHNTLLTVNHEGKVSKKGRISFRVMAGIFWEALAQEGWTPDQDVNIALHLPGEEEKKMKKGIAIIIDQSGHIAHIGYKPNTYAKKWWAAVKRARPKDDSEAEPEDQRP